jgi:Mrp family chromosome partitioning ATPase
MATPDLIEKAFERIRLRMLSFGTTLNGDDNTVLTITSRACGEGVTSTALGLAAEMSHEGRTLLIDASSEGKKIGESLGIVTEPLAIENISRANMQTKRFITQISDPSIDILSLSIPERSKSNLIDFNVPFWSEIRSYYKSIIVDSGSLQKPSALIWANWTDHTLLVIDASITSRETLEKFKSDLKKSNLNISGFIMNKRLFHIPNFLWSKVK